MARADSSSLEQSVFPFETKLDREESSRGCVGAWTKQLRVRSNLGRTSTSFATKKDEATAFLAEHRHHTSLPMAPPYHSITALFEPVLWIK